MTRLGVGQPILPPRRPGAPFFRPLVFQRKLALLTVPLMAPMFLCQILMAVVQAPALGWLRQLHVGAMPIFDFAGIASRHPGVGLGLISFGGIGLGIIGIGGFGVGLIAFGGAAVGVIAVGGGSVGVIAIGGGACGLIAIGGGAVGRFALAQRAGGKYVFALNRQDEPAIELFTRYFPSLRESLQSPMPVIPR